VTGYRRLLPYALQQWPALVWITSLTVLSASVAALQPLPMKLLVDNALGGHPLTGPAREVTGWLASSPSPAGLVALAAAASALLFALDSALDMAMSWAWSVAGQRMVNRLASDLFSRLQRLSLLFHARRPVGDSLDRLSTDSWCVYTFTANVLMSPVRHLIALATIGFVAFHLDARLAALALTAAPLLALSSYVFGQRLKRRARRSREAQARLVGLVQQTFAALPVVRAYGAEERHTRQFRLLAGDAVREAERNALLNRTYGLVNGVVVTCAMALVLLVGGRRAMAGSLSVGTLLVFLSYMRTLQSATEGLTKVYGSLKSLEASVDRVDEILAQPEAVTDGPGARQAPDGAPAIRFEEVTFGYQPERPVLHGVSLEIAAGESLALVGPSGAGKSTLASLLPRFYDPSSGRLSWNGLDLRELTLASLRERITIVPQEPFLLPISIAENIGYGRRGADREAILAAATAANADGFIRALPKGYDTVLGERGVTLSGGEKQRLAIARALLRDTPVVLLDEPTSALDAATEELVVQALQRLLAGRTTLIIAHRLSTIRFVDRVAVLEAGRVVELGTRAELLRHPRRAGRLDAALAGALEEKRTA